MTAGGNTSPLTPAEADRLFAGLSACRRLVIAVSGGADSLALMHLVADWRARRAVGAPDLVPAIVVVTVDHGLRAGSADEASAVGDMARGLGLAHLIQTYKGPGPAGPFSQSWARGLRYRLLAEVAVDGLSADPGAHAAIVTAHHLDDQAETVLMRLGRGSGLEGLGGIRPERRLSATVSLHRPLLAEPRARLEATLRARGVSWIDDPSNRDHRFERVRLRGQPEAMSKLGLSNTGLALTAHRLARADKAIDRAVDEALTANSSVSLTEFGYAHIEWDTFCTLAAELRLRILVRILARLDPRADHPVSLSQLEAITDHKAWRAPVGQTLHHCVFIGARDGAVLILPEIGRLQPVAPPLVPLRWCGFWLTMLNPPAGAFIGPLGPARSLVPAELLHPLQLPPSVIEAQPGLFAADRTLLSAPTLGWRAAIMTARPAWDRLGRLNNESPDG